MADAVSVAQHSNLGVLLDVGHQRIAASGDDQVYDIIQPEQIVHIFPGGDEADDIPADLQKNAWPFKLIETANAVAGADQANDTLLCNTDTVQVSSRANQKV